MLSERTQIYCKDSISQIENYDLAISDKSAIYQCHHRNEIVITKHGMICNSVQTLVKEGKYFNLPASELIYLSRKEHARIHHTARRLSKQLNDYCKYNTISDEMRNNIAKSYYAL